MAVAVAWLRRPQSRRKLNIPFVLVNFKDSPRLERKLRTIVSCGCALCEKLCLTGLIKGLIHGALMFADVASENKTERRELPFKFAFIAVRIVECLCSNLFIAQTVRQLSHSPHKKCIEITRPENSIVWYLKLERESLETKAQTIGRSNYMQLCSFSHVSGRRPGSFGRLSICLLRSSHGAIRRGSHAARGCETEGLVESESEA